MSKFRVIPVLDILNTKAVHAIKGERSKYQPLQSYLFNTSDPFEIIKILYENYKFKEFYIADLDSIINNKPNITLITKIIESFDVDIMLDPGIVNSDDISSYKTLELDKIILGLETIDNLDLIADAIKINGSRGVILSYDLYKEKVITKIDKLKSKKPLEIIKIIESKGIQEVILLDLFRVGQKIGEIPPLYLEIRNSFKGNLLVGGGIKNLNDIKNFSVDGFSGVLIATALYDGTIDIESLVKII